MSRKIADVIGKAQHFMSPKMSGYAGHWRIDFDSGITAYVPDSIFADLEFDLGKQEAKPAAKIEPPGTGRTQ